MLKLRHSTTSPYVRKVMVALHELRLTDLVEVVPATPWAPDSDVPADNPLGKVPALLGTEIGPLFDSPVIVEYLDQRADGDLVPRQGAARWTALRRQALADGLLDAMVARLLELRRPADKQLSSWIERQETAARRTLDFFETEAASFGDTIDVGTLTVAVALGYIDFRCPQLEWRQGRPQLARWYESIAQRPSLQATVPFE